jgi:hypothetical protein
VALADLGGDGFRQQTAELAALHVGDMPGP